MENTAKLCSNIYVVESLWSCGISMIEYAVFGEFFYDIGKVYVDFSQFYSNAQKIESPFY